MTAKEKILDGIAANASQKAEEIISEAEREAESIRLSQLQLAETEKSKILVETEKKAEAIKNNATSSAALLKRDTILKFKRGAIATVLEECVSRLNSYSDKEYFDFLYSLVEKNVLSGNGLMLLNKNDALRDNLEFKEKISKLGLELCDETADINGGFILKYDDILINCAFEALINEKKERLIDVINKELFC